MEKIDSYMSHSIMLYQLHSTISITQDLFDDLGARIVVSVSRRGMSFAIPEMSISLAPKVGSLRCRIFLMVWSRG